MKHLPSTPVPAHPRLPFLTAAFVLAAFLSAALPARAASPAPANLAPAERALLEGDADLASSLLHTALAADPTDGHAHLLLCRVLYSEELPADAAAECQTAIASLPNDSAAQDWAGRAFGMQANSAGPIAGLRLARRVHLAFETALQLDPRNPDALNDLGEFEIDAPAFLGGGFDKAAHLADRANAFDPQLAHRLRALSAEKQKNLALAETEFRAAVGVAGHADAWVDLGLFYIRRQQLDQAADALRHAIAADRSHDAALADAAMALTGIHREPRLAERAFRDYLASPIRSDAQPAFRVRVNLAKLLLAEGDKAAAKIELDRALAQASHYAPARQALASL